MPKLIEFYNQHEDDDRFEIIAFHDASVKTLAEVDEKVADKKEKHWGGQDLPFPVMIDASGETISEWEIMAFPTLVLIDPDGRLVGHATLETLQEALAGNVETPQPLEATTSAGEGSN